MKEPRGLMSADILRLAAIIMSMERRPAGTAIGRACELLQAGDMMTADAFFRVRNYID